MAELKNISRVDPLRRRYGIIARTQYPGTPPRVEYALTPFGEHFAAILDGIDALQREIDADARGR